MPKFAGATFKIGLVPYGISTEYDVVFSKKSQSGYRCFDFASDHTGGLVATLLMQIAERHWKEAQATLELIQKEELE